MELLLSNEDAIKAQLLYWLQNEGRTSESRPIGIALDFDIRKCSLAQIASGLEGVIATAQAALRTIDEMREAPMDLAETAVNS